MTERTHPLRLRDGRPSGLAGFAAAAAAVAAATGLIYPLKTIAPVVSLGVVYLPAVLFISAYWGLWLGLVTSAASALAFNFFHLPPVGRFTISGSGNWVALAAFTLVAVATSTIAELARSRALEAERRRQEADLAAELARSLLSGIRTEEALSTTAHRVAGALGLASAGIELGTVEGDERRRALALHGPDGRQIATLLVPHSLPDDDQARLRSQVVPSLEALVAIALARDAVQTDAVETAALRRSDDVKTALLRAVSHDLRSPLTAIVAAGHALGTRSVTPEDRHELSAAVVQRGEQLARMVDKLLDLSRLQAGRAEPRREWISLEEVLASAEEGLATDGASVRMSVDPDLPPIYADGAQVERAFANLLENAVRYSSGEPVLVRARAVGSRIITRVVDRGPGISLAQRERIFEPFYRDRLLPAGHAGSGLGLSIARGFIEANGGQIAVESLPGQGTSFVVTWPVNPGPSAPGTGHG